MTKRKAPEDLLPRGQPSKFSPAYVEEVVNYCAEGYSLTAFAGHIGVDRDTISEWAKVHPDFSAAVRRAKAKRAAWWEAKARGVGEIGGTGGQSTMIMFALKNFAPDEFKEKQEIEHSGTLKLSQVDDHHLNEQIVAAMVANGVPEAKARAFVTAQDGESSDK